MNKELTTTTDLELLEGLKKSENWAYKLMYKKYYKMCASHVAKNSGNDEEAMDLFQDAIIALMGNVVKPNFKLNEGTKLSTYFNSIFRNLWLTKLKKAKKNKSEDLETHSYNLTNGDNELFEIIELEKKHEQIAECFLKIGEDCKKLLTDFYYKKIPLGEVGEQMGYTPSFVRVKKGRCMTSLRKCALEN